MSLEKAIFHGKEHRKPYPKGDPRNYDWSCRNHKSCTYCANNRQFTNRKRKTIHTEERTNNVKENE